MRPISGNSGKPDVARSGRGRRLAWLAIVVLLVAMPLAWRYGPLASLADPATLARDRQALRDLPAAPLVIVGGFLVGGLVAAPATALIGATTLVFGAWPGAAWAWLGMLANASLVFALARRGARGAVERWLAGREGGAVERIARGLERRGLVAVGLMRLTPLPYTLQNAAAGASRVRYRDFLLGTAVGVVPVVALFAGIAFGVDNWLDDPRAPRLAVAAAAAFAIAIAVALIRRRARANRRDQDQ